MKAYLSHPIRGFAGVHATPAMQRANCDRAKRLAKIIRAIRPDIGLYVPAESEDFISRAFDEGYLTIKQILAIDCQIVTASDLVIFYNFEGELSLGMKKEHDAASVANKQIMIVTDPIDIDLILRL
ncbi:MAG TPA: hypothetical protein VMW50_08275 [Dehalococcoidia bacterium]|nr:hypothetical protein [Dehalococcoidia bacterium]